MEGRGRGSFQREAFEESQIRKSLMVVSQGSGASIQSKKKRHEEKEEQEE